MSSFGLALTLICAVLTMAANLLLRAGVSAAGGITGLSVTDLLRSLVLLFTEPKFLGGFVLYFAASVVWFRIISTEPLTTAYPVLVSLTFVLVTGGAVFWFAEPVSLRKVLGIACILLGILVASTEPTMQPNANAQVVK